AEINDKQELIDQHAAGAEEDVYLRKWEEMLNIETEIKKIVSETRKWDEEVGSGYKKPNVYIYFSQSAKKDTQQFFLRPMIVDCSENLYALSNMNDPMNPKSSHIVRPNEYRYYWDRKGLSPTEKVTIPDGKQIVFAVHSNFLGNQTKVYEFPMDYDISGITASNAESFYKEFVSSSKK
ncbi:MAG: hypothetical protein HQL31_10190, partial [Planctomycetes bacterium]|nr:hypothetical protein [Planctomycetota bacterium]